MAEASRRISTEKYRAEDLELDDIVQLRISNRVQWVLLTSDAVKGSNDLTVKLAYRPLIGNTAHHEIGRYELVPVQIQKGT